MRYVVSLSLIMSTVFVAATVFAQTGTICLYADPEGRQCSISDTAPGLLSVYVIHSPGSAGLRWATGAQFSAPKPACMAGVTWITDTSPFPGGAVIGNSQTGVAVTYGSCATLPAHVLTVQYMVSGLTETDCAYPIVRDPSENVILVATCDGASLVQGAGGVSYVNSLLPCECSEPIGPPILSVSPTSMDLGLSAAWGVLEIWNAGGSALTWSIAESAPWLTLEQTTGTGFYRGRVYVSRSGLPPGKYATELEVSSNGGTLTVQVSMEVEQGLSVSPEALRFQYWETRFYLQVRDERPEPVTWTVSLDQPWLSASPTIGTGTGSVRVSVSRSGLTDGIYAGTITVSGGSDVIRVPVTMIVASVPGPGGTIGVFSDPQASGCNLLDRVPGLMSVYVVHVLTPGSTASQFAAPKPACMIGATYLGESSQFPVTIGNTQTGVSIGYGSCRNGPIHLLTVQYFALGQTPACCLYPVIPDPQSPSGEIAAVDCNFFEGSAAGSHAVINPDASCQCASVKTEEATWGKIKSMYSDE